MKYRRIERLDWYVSVLGLNIGGTPLAGPNSDKTNDGEIVKLIRYAVDHGVNYLDLGYLYELPGCRPLAAQISEALQDGYQQKIRVAANLSPYLINSVRDFDRQLNDQMGSLQLAKIDLCLLAGLNRKIWPKLKELRVLEWAESAIHDGRIESLGFSFHDDHHVLKNIINDYDNWSVCKFPYSYFDHLNHHPGLGGLKYAAKKGVGVVVSEPLREERGLGELPETVAKAWAKAPCPRPETELGLRWLWNHPEVATVAMQISTVDQLAECLLLADAAAADELSVRELLQLNQVRDAYRQLRPFPCPSCHCCMPCPTGVLVPRIFELYNDAVIYHGIEKARFSYTLEQLGFQNCTGCGACAESCPREFPILDWLNTAHQLLTGR